jgi:hypothetical protein
MRAPVIVLFAAIGTLACLSPAQNDTWWHLRAGQEMVRTHRLLFEDVFSYTAYGQFFWNHSWLSQLLFYALYRLGGLPLLTGVCAAAILGAWIIVWRLMTGPFTDRIVLLAVALSSATVTWSVRPQVFSMLLAAVVLWLVVDGRWRLVPVVLLLWANLHAGFVLGLVVIAAALGATLLWDRDRLRARAGWAALAGLATLATPLGVRNWIEVLASMARSRANVIQEWQPTPLPPAHVAFWGLALLLLVLAVARWKRLATTADRTLVIAALIVLPLAVRSLRNVPAFAMIVLPAISRLLFRGSNTNEAGNRRTQATWIGGLAIAVAAIVVIIAWSQPWAALGWEPLGPAAASAIRECPPNLYNTYEGGGPIIWFVPSQRVFLDSRQDPFPVALVQAASALEGGGDYHAVFAEWQINCAALPPTSPTAHRLVADGWTTRYVGPQWVVLARPPS